jgi:predicted nucleic-acid-binding Zn-ribbon protein
LLHGKVFDKQLPEFETITLFKRKYDEFYEFGEDHENDLMWYALKALVDSE